jgi:hypothetical protein
VCRVQATFDLFEFVAQYDDDTGERMKYHVEAVLRAGFISTDTKAQVCSFVSFVMDHDSMIRHNEKDRPIVVTAAIS